MTDEGTEMDKKQDYLACDHCGIVYAELKRIGDWQHYAKVGSGHVVPVYDKTGKKICDECMN